MKSSNEKQATQTLIKLLNLVNLIPHQISLPYTREITQAAEKSLKDKGSPAPLLGEILEKSVAMLKMKTKQFPTLICDVSTLLDEIRGEMREPENVVKQLLDYHDFWATREAIWYYAKGDRAIIYSPLHDGSPWVHLKFSERYIEELDWVLFKKHYVRINDEQFSFEANILEPALINIDLDRLRICRYCERVFWAFRIESKGCSKRCNENLRAIRYRAEEKKNAQNGFLQGLTIAWISSHSFWKRLSKA